MNEKDLYFQPENYGKKEHKEPKKKSEKKDQRILKLLGFLLFLLIIILIIIWLLRGKHTTSGRFPENVKNESLTCISYDIVPPKISSAYSEDKELRINAIFNGTDDLKSISLIYTTNYSSSDEAYAYEAKSHAEFNNGLSASGYSSTEFSNKFSRYDSSLIISLYTIKDRIDDFSAPYFMINRLSDVYPSSLRDYKRMYEQQGFTCVTTIE